jgi:enoyl-CoA hydratase
MAREDIYLEVDGEFAWLVINRPAEQNALTQDMWWKVPGLVSEAEENPDVKILIIRGAGGVAFSVGGDISEFEEMHRDKKQRDRNREAVSMALRSLYTTKKPAIAMIQGVCAGAGCGVALACDMRFATPGSRFSITPARIGLAHSLEEAKTLVEIVGPSIAKMLLFTGRQVRAEEALRSGLIDEILPHEEVEDRVREFAGSICRNSQYSVRSIKRIIGLVQEGYTSEIGESWRLVLDAYDGEDYREGLAAFAERREPKFTYRG